MTDQPGKGRRFSRALGVVNVDVAVLSLSGLNDAAPPPPVSQLEQSLTSASTPPSTLPPGATLARHGARRCQHAGTEVV